MKTLKPWQRCIARAIVVLALPFVAFACGLAAMKWRIWAGNFVRKESHGRS